MLQPGQDETKFRLLNAAGEVFAEKGFQAGTIREICTRAGANVASVNYHFGGKSGLYEALLEHCHQEGLSRHPAAVPTAQGADPQARAEEALAAFVRSFLKRTLGSDGPGWSTRLMAREMGNPSPALERMVHSSIRPNLERLMGIVSTLLGEGASPQDVRHCALSVVGQCRHYYRARATIEILFPDVTWDDHGIDILVCHIVRFSLAAIRGYRESARDKATAQQRREGQEGQR
jgi:TetR/AcrR family transcriptional regulator, regulator of cefoperazone and chloramphenicol sensitivity